MGRIGIIAYNIMLLVKKIDIHFILRPPPPYFGKRTEQLK
jgi:hypothetical protein